MTYMLFRFIISLSCGGFGEYLEGLRQQIEAEIAALRSRMQLAPAHEKEQLEVQIRRLQQELAEKSGGSSGGCT